MTIHWLWIGILLCLLLVLLAGRLYELIAAARDARRCPPIGEMIDIGGRKLHMVRKGSGGPTVVMESSSSSSSIVWWALQDQLAELTTVVSYDRAGLGWSDSVSLPRTLDERAADLHALLVRANVPSPYVLVGFSFGGLLIRLFARDHREDVVGMVFVDSGHEAVYSPPQTHATGLSKAFKFYGAIASIGVFRLFRIDIRAFLRTRPVTMLTDAQRHVMSNRFVPARAYFIGADEMASAVYCGVALAGTNTPGCLGDIPIAVITHGIPLSKMSGVSEKDWHAAQEQLATLSTNSMLVVARNSGHAIPSDEPEIVLETIRKIVIAARSNEWLAR